MPAADPLGLELRPRGILSRVPVGPKLLFLLALGLLTYWLPWPPMVLITLLVGLLLLALSGATLRRIRKGLAGIMVIALVLFAFNWFFAGLDFALIALGRLLAVYCAGMAITFSTHYSQLLDFFMAALRPLCRPLKLMRLSPPQVALAFSLTIRFIPEILKIQRQVQEAQKARGLQRRPLAFFVPLIYRTLLMADEVAAAVIARGFENRGFEKPEPAPGGPPQPKSEKHG